jgi:hypothetical protein
LNLPVAVSSGRNVINRSVTHWWIVAFRLQLM